MCWIAHDAGNPSAVMIHCAADLQTYKQNAVVTSRPRCVQRQHRHCQPRRPRPCRRVRRQLPRAAAGEPGRAARSGWPPPCQREAPGPPAAVSWRGRRRTRARHARPPARVSHPPPQGHATDHCGACMRCAHGLLAGKQAFKYTRKLVASRQLIALISRHTAAAAGACSVAVSCRARHPAQQTTTCSPCGAALHCTRQAPACPCPRLRC